MYAELIRKKCSKCGKRKSLTKFQKDERYRFGVKGICRPCLNEYSLRKQFAVKYAAKNKEKIKAYQRQWRQDNKERYDKSRREWVRKNSKKVLAETRKYQAAKMLRMPQWLSEKQLEQLKIFYLNCPDGFEVDHILPLQGEIVSGLHVPSNLQYLLRSTNRAKSNKY